MKLTFYFDTVSPYSWFAMEILSRYQSIWDIEMNMVPFYLAGVMHESENQPPGMNKFKAKYMYKDLVRNGKLYNVPLTAIPSKFPDNSLKAQRILTAVKLYEPSKLISASRAIWQCYWRDGMNLSDEDNLVKYLTPVLGSTTPLFVSKHASDLHVKKLLTDNTQAATHEGAFGAPWIIVEHQNNGVSTRDSFFGSDRIEQIALLLKKPYYGPQPTDNLSGTSKL
ncbi:hypothetical protein QVD99_005654 [Batrachochytrium dendrobatidis]|nr:hypothetical protein O5D80_001162 [Batrachochytrium dendrobatidis]KAK5667811.1 hypothetical protein QVD99_005654 [Batrachochytrium dendrobatidis]OAJ32766.1 hypothetical protein BDEG_28647 [Batrachochytrium dendrobatidis JEL423]